MGKQTDLFEKYPHKAFAESMLAIINRAISAIELQLPEYAELDASTQKKADEVGARFERQTTVIELERIRRTLEPQLPKTMRVALKDDYLLIETPTGKTVFPLDQLWTKRLDYQKLAKSSNEFSPPPAYRMDRQPQSSFDSSMRNAYRDALRLNDKKTAKALEVRYGKVFLEGAGNRTKLARKMGRVNRVVRARGVMQSVHPSRKSSVSTAPAPVVNSSTNSTTMTDAEKEALKKRLAKGKADAAKKREAAAKMKGSKPESKPKSKAKPASKKKSTAPAKAKANDKPAVKKKSTSKTTTVRRRAMTKKTAQEAKKSTAKKSATRSRSRTTVRVRSGKELEGMNFIQQVREISNEIHKKSATGEFRKVPIYNTSRKEADKIAFETASRTRKAKNVTNVRLKIK